MASEGVAVSSDFITVEFQWLSEVRRILKDDFGMTIPQFMVLESIYLNGETTATGLAKSGYFSQGTVSYLLKTLESRGCIARCEDERKRSTFIIRLTAAGIGLIEGAERSVADLAEGGFEPLDDLLREAAVNALVTKQHEGRAALFPPAHHESGEMCLARILSFEKSFKDALRPYGLGAVEFRVMYDLLTSECGCLRPSELANRLILKLADVSHALDNLLERGLIDRSRISDDRRGVVVVLSDEGRDLALAAASSINAMVDKEYPVERPEVRALQNEAASVGMASKRGSFLYY